VALQGQTAENGSIRAQHEEALADAKALVAKNDELTNQLANLVHENEGYKTAPGLEDRCLGLETHALELEQSKAAVQQELTAAHEKADLEYKGRAAAEVLVNDLREKMRAREEELETESTRKDEEFQGKAKKEKAWKAENLKHTKWLEKNNKELQDKELALKEQLESSGEDLKHSQVELQALYIYIYIYISVYVCACVCV